MRSLRGNLRAPLLIIASFAALLALGGCGDNSTLVTDRDTGKHKKPDAGGGGLDVGYNDTDSPGDDTGVTPDAQGGNDTSGPQDPCLDGTPAQASEFAHDFATALCERIFACTDSPQLATLVTFGGWSSMSDCVQGVASLTLSPGQAQQALQNGTLRLNTCKTNTCLSSLQNAHCGALHQIFSENRAVGFDACYDAWDGTLGADRSCTVDAQCAGHQVCVRATDAPACEGKCADAGAPGEGACGDNVCRGDQYCSSANQICMTRPALGEACTNDEKVCNVGAECVNGQCVAIQSGLSEGDACDIQNKLCSFDLVCLGECATPHPEGAQCQFFGCEADFYCSEGGECTRRGSEGDTCQSDMQCLSNRCAGGVCTDLNSLCP